jgi:glutathione S-transferase
LIRLYDFLDSGNGYKVRLLLTQLKIPFERVEIDILDGESRTEEFLAINPNGRIPVLEMNAEERLCESNAILVYLAEGTPFLPKARWQRAKVLEWLFFEQYSHEPNIATPRFWLKHFPITEDRRPLLEQKTRLGYEALAVMERHLSRRAFFVADEYTIADIALYACTHVAHEGGFDLTAFDAVRAWLDRVRSQPGHIPITQG